MCESVFFCLYKAHGHCDCCDAMYAFVQVFFCSHMAYAHGDCCEAMHACVRVCVGLCKAHGHCDCWEAMMFAVSCVFVSYEAVCLVCALSLLLLKQAPSSRVDDLMFDFIDFLLCRNSTGRIVVW